MKPRLEELKKNWRSQSVLALTVAPSGITATLVRRGRDPLPPLVLQRGAAELLEDPAQAGAELAAALDRAQIRERRCVVALPLSWALSAAADLPSVGVDDLRGYFELRAEREFAMSDLRLAHSAWHTPEGTPRATLAAIPAKRIEAVEKMLEAAGCRAVSLSLALEGSLAGAEPTLHLLTGKTETGVLVSSGGGIAALRTLAAAASGGSGAFARELRITLGRLPESVRQRVQRARIVGEPDPALRQLLERSGFEPVREEPGTPGGAAVEWAVRFLQEQPVPFELLIPQESRWPAMLERWNTQRSRRAAAIAGALIALLLLVFGVRAHMESSLAAEWAGMQSTVGELETLQQKIRQFRPWFQPGPQKLQALETVIAAFPERGDVWARSVQISSDKTDTGPRAQLTGGFKLTISGFAQNSAAVLALQERLGKQPGVTALQLQQYRGNNPIQFSLTCKWEPKHEK